MSQSENAIRLRDLGRDYGERPALDGVGLELPAGSSLAVLGPNGSGKSTLLRVLASLLRPSRGEVSVLGCSLPREAWKLRGQIGYLGHEPLLYEDLTGRENLEFQARLYGLPAAEARQRIESDLELLGMGRRADYRVSDYSAGMKQRIAICRAVLHRPALLLLDEPDSNLDPEGREAARALIGRPDELRWESEADRPVTRVAVSHDPEKARAEADQVLELTIGGAPVARRAVA
ncbi:MAG: ABC transporter ATP-binding protein [Solirubrobacterales bacterium]|nr:ABC transporter ATP-binding protein [Solirubrobacterales bacterium]OJU96114.1 MAG: hypothetical protein BGO23_00890 [Solirubrobacterales bacterium 67-14]